LDAAADFDAMAVAGLAAVVEVFEAGVVAAGLLAGVVCALAVAANAATPSRTTAIGPADR
jgi:hypothetical protein